MISIEVWCKDNSVFTAKYFRSDIYPLDVDEYIKDEIARIMDMFGSSIWKLTVSYYD